MSELYINKLYLLLIGGWLVFFTAHSLLAASAVKRWVYKRLPKAPTWYRMLYNIISLTFLLPVVLVLWLLPNEQIWESPSGLMMIGVIIGGFGLYVLYDSFKAYHSGEFFGFYQLKARKDYEPDSFNITGWNRIVRHPLYFGTILFAVGLAMAMPAIKWLVSCSFVIVYTIIGTYWEEQKLIKSFGEAYKQYRQQVPMLIPHRFPKKGR